VAADLDGFADRGLPHAELLARYLHDTLTDPRPMRLLDWRGFANPGAAPPDSTPATEDLARPGGASAKASG
jgi:hypothetical protein